MDTILIIEGLYKHFDGIVAVDNVRLNIPRGTITGICGENGAGKSTLFNLISGFEKPDNGKVFFNSKEITNINILGRARMGMGRLFQTPRIFLDVTVKDNLMAAAKNSTGHHFYNYFLKRSLVRNEARLDSSRADKILGQINLQNKATFKAFELSIGERKLLSLGCLLMNEAKLLLLDEPFAGINEKMIERLNNIFIDINQQGVTLLLIEHNKDAIKFLCDSSFEMKQGKII